ncbi:MAG TPA: hypothetical protein VJY54_04915 [Lachnospiraceae bacterium]|nr:hypothetical protein [Lachnospiraceae bacterium]
MKNQLIIVDGQSTVGKSSISKGLYMQIAGMEDVNWLHEECENHPIRNQEFEAGDIHTAEGMKRNRIQMLNKWKASRDEIMKSNKRCITEGCFLHSLDRYLLESIWDEKEIEDFYQQIIEILRPLNPLIVFLYRPNIKMSYEKAFTARGEWWKNLILGTPEPYGYFENHEYNGDESIFDGLSFEQEQMKKIYQVLKCDKLMIDTSKEDWTSYVCELTQKIGYQYRSSVNKEFDPKKYSGTYQIEKGNNLWKIEANDDGQLYSSLFWPYIPMKYVENDSFEFISFPVKIMFDESKDTQQFIVEGNYDWEYNGKRFIRI